MADSKARFQSILNTQLFDAADPKTAAKVLRHMLTKYSRDQLEEFIRMPPDGDRESGSGGGGGDGGSGRVAAEAQRR